MVRKAVETVADDEEAIGVAGTGNANQANAN